MQKIPVLLHIPHSSQHIPSECRAEICLSPTELETELRLMTDAFTDEAAAGDWATFVVKAQVSRLVVDVERFRSDADESMSHIGMGAVYEKTQNGQLLRSISAVRREALLRRYYDPHHAIFTWAVGEMLERFHHCLIIDVHSFPSQPLPYEIDPMIHRPDICIGTDDYHTPQNVANAAIRFFEEKGWQVQANRPFAGSIVPLAYYNQDKRVFSVMVEINRSLIMNETTGGRKDAATHIFGVFPSFAKRMLDVL